MGEKSTSQQIYPQKRSKQDKQFKTCHHNKLIFSNNLAATSSINVILHFFIIFYLDIYGEKFPCFTEFQVNLLKLNVGFYCGNTKYKPPAHDRNGQ